MANNSVESNSQPQAPDTSSGFRFDRRKFLIGSAAIGLDLVAPSALRGRSVEAKATPELLQLPSETAFLMGPGNAHVPGTMLHEYGTYAMLPAATPIELNAQYGDFVRGKATYIKETDGKEEEIEKNGYIYKGDAPSIPDGLKELTIEQVPWVKTPMVAKEGFIVEPGKTDPTQFTPYYKTLEDTDAKVNFKMTTEGSSTEDDFIGLIIANPEANGAGFSALTVFKKDGYWALNHQQLDQWEEIAQLSAGDNPNEVEASIRISKDGSTVTIQQGDNKSDPITLPTPLLTRSRILDLYGIDTAADGLLTVNQMNILTPPSGKYVEEETA